MNARDTLEKARRLEPAWYDATTLRRRVPEINSRARRMGAQGQLAVADVAVKLADAGAVAPVVRISARDSATSGQSASGYRCHEAANAAAQTSTSSAERAKCAVLQSSESNGKGQVAPAPPGKRGEGQCRLAR